MRFLKKLFKKTITEKNVVEDQEVNAVNEKIDIKASIENTAEIMNMILNKVYMQGEGLYDFDITDSANWHTVAEKILNTYSKRHFYSGMEEQVIALLRGFLTNRQIMYGLFMPHPALAFCGSILMNCKDNSTIREWAVDFYGRTCELAKSELLIDFLSLESNPKVLQESVAALSKLLKYRDPDEEVIKNISAGYIILLRRLQGDLININGEGFNNAIKIFEETLRSKQK